MVVRALLRMIETHHGKFPYDVIRLKIFYPALDAQSDAERESGLLPFDPRFQGCPITIFLPGVNCSASSYEWLACHLAAHGIVTLLPEWIAQNLAGRVSITPGIDLEAVSPRHYGTRPTSTSLTALAAALSALQHDPVIGSYLDTDALIFGGHSAGGTMALQNSAHRWFPQVKAAFAICANPLATAALGQWERGVIPPMPSDCPALLIGASDDATGNHHNQLFGIPTERADDTIRRSFDETGYRYGAVCIFQGANHYTVCDPLDTTIGRSYLEGLPSLHEGEIRATMARLITTFIQATVQGNPQARDRLSEQPAHASYWKLSQVEVE